jgi:mannonate dehydratase|tara:strand:+ start:270 stop:1424 length:1155 start_codon:yes stop_codon:yes gene_type:complete
MSLIQSWRWFGPNDSVSLQDILQAGATDVVSALHYIPHGEVWPLEEILERKSLIEASGLKWSIVESVPVHESIKTRSDASEKYLDNYRTTLKNLSKAGLKLVCYNFMPVLDWTRTDLSFVLQNGAKALYFDWADLASFDQYILQRKNAFSFYSDEVVELAKQRWVYMNEERKKELSDIILMGVPTEKSMTKEDLMNSIAIYKEIGKDGLRDNLVYFLKSIQQICEEEGITMTIHPDDPPFPILGLPRIASNDEDLLYILDKVPESFNGVCFCTGSLGAGAHNDLPDILAKVGERVHFAHLRNVKRNNRGDFYEAEHLDGDVDMVSIMQQLIRLNNKRNTPIIYRPDHGHQLLDDLDKQTNPGYSAIGRLKGLAELRGLEKGLDR